MPTQTLDICTTDAIPAIRPRTEAGERALRRRARKVARRRPPSGMVATVPRSYGVLSAGSDRVAVDEGYSLSRWARLACTLTVLAVVVVVTCVALTPSAPVHSVQVTVTAGDTLWSIARQAQPDADPRAVIDTIRSINGLNGDGLPVGLVLQVPTVDGP